MWNYFFWGPKYAFPMDKAHYSLFWVFRQPGSAARVCIRKKGDRPIHPQTVQQLFDTAVCLDYTFVGRLICPANRLNPGKITPDNSGIF
jgi:hypothetical protein